jgi:esterase/lipase superfamily enzyme
MFSQVVFAAPDVDADVFKDLVTAYTTVSRRRTLYISDRDKALALSTWLREFPRAGYAPPIPVYDHVDTVHVSNVDVSLLGHGYIARARDVLNDLHTLIKYDTPPQDRMGLKPAVLRSGERYWVIGA